MRLQTNNIKFCLISALAISLFSCVSACTTQNNYINRPQDITQGKKYLDTFYKNIQDSNLVALSDLLSDSLSQNNGKEKFVDLLKFIRQKLGDFKAYDVEDQYTKTVTGSFNYQQFHFKLKVHYSKQVSDEVVGFESQNGGRVRLINYHSNSDALFH